MFQSVGGTAAIENLPAETSVVLVLSVVTIVCEWGDSMRGCMVKKTLMRIIS